jgi:hypothetical protein
METVVDAVRRSRDAAPVTVSHKLELFGPVRMGLMGHMGLMGGVANRHHKLPTANRVPVRGAGANNVARGRPDV